MDDDQSYFYLKFKLSEKLKVMENMIVSEARSTVDAWTGAPSERGTKSPPKTKPNPSPFKQVIRDFEGSIETFKTTVPFIMRSLPIMRQISDDRNIRQFVSKTGKKLETTSSEFELYQLRTEHMGAISRKIDGARAISAGVNRIPELFLMGLIGTYDQFLSQLIKCIFEARPELLSSSEKNISFKDLIEIGSIDAARDRIIEKEIESVIRESHSKQIEWLERKLDMPLRKELRIWPEFIEICERRNLISHTNGVVSSQYMTVCREHGVALDNVILGRKLMIGSKYYKRAVSVILEFGVKLTQVVWRKLKPYELDEAATGLNNSAYNLICKRMYEEANALLRFGLYEMKKHGTELTRKMMVINLANAEKLSGNKDKAEVILQKEDWSAVTDSFIISIAAIRDDVDAVVNLMKSVVNSGHLEISDFRDWPVFETVRADPKFIETFEREFSQKLVADFETPAPLKVETEVGETDGTHSSDKEKTIH